MWMRRRTTFQGLKMVAQRLYFLILVNTYRRCGTVVAFVKHNEIPHSWPKSREEWMQTCSRLWQSVDVIVHMTETSRQNECSSLLQKKPGVIVPHPHYDLVDPVEHGESARRISRLVVLGGLERRKNALAAVQTALDIGEIEIIVSGTSDGSPWQNVVAPQATTSSLHIHSGLIEESDLYAMFDGSAAVILNQRTALNSGVMFLALSRGAPVICPDSRVNLELQEEFGTNWIRTFSGVLTTAGLRELIAEPVPRRLPDLAGRDAFSVGQELMSAVQRGAEARSHNL
jgi:hypothetical protein